MRGRGPLAGSLRLRLQPHTDKPVVARRDVPGLPRYQKKNAQLESQASRYQEYHTPWLVGVARQNYNGVAVGANDGSVKKTLLGRRVGARST